MQVSAGDGRDSRGSREKAVYFNAPTHCRCPGFRGGFTDWMNLCKTYHYLTAIVVSNMPGLFN